MNAMTVNESNAAEREQQLKQQEEAARYEEEQAKKSPFDNWVQLNMEHRKELGWLISAHPKAASILLFLIERMDGYNAIVCSNKVIQDALSISRPTVTRAIKILKDYNFIKIAKTGTANVYYINSELVWKSWGTNHRYAEFGAKIIIAESEQEQDAADTTTHRVPTATIKPRRKRKGDNSDKHTESAQTASTVG